MRVGGPLGREGMERMVEHCGISQEEKDKTLKELRGQ
jgi:hypothetical protein